MKLDNNQNNTPISQSDFSQKEKKKWAVIIINGIFLILFIGVLVLWYLVYKYKYPKPYYENLVKYLLIILIIISVSLSISVISHIIRGKPFIKLKANQPFLYYRKLELFVKYLVTIGVILSLIGTGVACYGYYDIFYKKSNTMNNAFELKESQIYKYEISIFTNNTNEYELIVPFMYPINCSGTSGSVYERLAKCNDSELDYDNEKLTEIFSQDIINVSPSVNLLSISIVNLSITHPNNTLKVSQRRYNNWGIQIKGRGNLTIDYEIFTNEGIYGISMKSLSPTNGSMDNVIVLAYFNSSELDEINLHLSTRSWVPDHKNFSSPKDLNFYLPNKIYKIHAVYLKNGWNELSNWYSQFD